MNSAYRLITIGDATIDASRPARRGAAYSRVIYEGAFRYIGPAAT
jgi:hypothetical protein